MMIAAALAAAGCGGGSGADASGEIGFATIYQGNATGSPDAQSVVVRDNGVWLAFWVRFAGSVGGLIPLIDFSTKMVVAVFLGPRPTSCASVSISEVIGGPLGLTIDYREDASAPGAICNQVTSYPVHIVLVDANPQTVRFVKT